MKKRKSRKTNRKTKGTEVAVVDAAESVPFDVDPEDPAINAVALDPRKAKFMQFYYDRESPTWGNAKQSAIAAGFGENYACQITYRKPQWWLDFVRQQNMADLIEQHFTEVMQLPSVVQAMGAFGPLFAKETIKEEVGVFKTGKRKGQKKFVKREIKVPIMVPATSIIKEKTAVAKIAAPAHNPEKYRQKATGKVSYIFNIRAAREEFNGEKNED